MKTLWSKYKKFFGPAFVLLELVMHLYLSGYLTFHWTNWTIYLFTWFESAGFIYLMVDNRNKKLKKSKINRVRELCYKECDEDCSRCETPPITGLSISVSHLKHYQSCNCLGDSAICCRPECICKENND